MGRRVVHFTIAVPWLGAGREGRACDGYTQGGIRDGHLVTCKRCRRSRAWVEARNKATALYDEVFRVLLRTDFGWARNRERIANLFGGPLHPKVHVLIALDRYEETPPDERDPAALARELCPVEPGWLS